MKVPPKHPRVAIVGAGLVGTLLAIRLAQRGCPVDVYEKRENTHPRVQSRGRSLNLTLTERGCQALAAAACLQQVLAKAVPMLGWYYHQGGQRVLYQPYGEQGEAIYAIARQSLNEILLEQALSCGVKLHFNTQVIGLECASNTLDLCDRHKQHHYRIKADYTVIADGAFSVLRRSFGEQTPGFKCAIERAEHTYKEFRFSAAAVMQAGWETGVHVWHRSQQVLLALPNRDGGYNVILFAPTKGPASFAALASVSRARQVFQQQFTDALSLMPRFAEDYCRTPESQLQTVDCWPWANGRAVLLGDAAHGILPFYGQGANAGFESCTELLTAIARSPNDWGQAFRSFQRQRKPDTDAIATISRHAYRELLQDEWDERVLRKNLLEQKLAQALPGKIAPLYWRVSFSNLCYADILQKDRIQQDLLEQLMARPDAADPAAFSKLADVALQAIEQRSVMDLRKLSYQGAVV